MSFQNDLSVARLVEPLLPYDVFLPHGAETPTDASSLTPHGVLSPAAEPPLRDVVATPLLVVSFPPLVMEKAVMALPAEVEVAFVQEVETVDIQTYWEV